MSYRPFRSTARYALVIACVVPLSCSRRKGDRSAVDGSPEARAAAAAIETVPTPELTARMQAALDSAFPGFELWTSRDYDAALKASYRMDSLDGLAWTAGDFNGDGLRDVVLTGHAGRRVITVALLSRGATFEATTGIGAAMSAKDTIGAPRSVMTLRRVPGGTLTGVTADAVAIRYIDPDWPGRPQDVFLWDATKWVLWREGE